VPTHIKKSNWQRQVNVASLAEIGQGSRSASSSKANAHQDGTLGHLRMCN
jgi:hypothetical protein